MELRDYLRAVLGVERVGAWLVAILTVAVVVSVATAGVPTVGGPPTVDVTTRYDAAAQQYTVAHAGGGSITGGQSLTVVVASGTHTANVTWVGDGGVTEFPVSAGASITIDDARVDSDGDGDFFDADATVGFALTGEETIRVLWTGRPLGAQSTRTVVVGSGPRANATT